MIFVPPDLIPVICIAGPTASGKTELAVNTALKFGGEIISADSMQIYKEFEISTAKPSEKQLKIVPHHLINILSVSEEFSVAEFKNLASECINDIYLRKKLPFLVGGTGLYIDSLLKNIDFEAFSNIHEKKFNNSQNFSNGKFIEKLNNSQTFSNEGLVEKFDNFKNYSNEKLARILKETDPISAEKIHANDTKRLKRAIEFFYASGYPISEQTEKSKNAASPYKVCKIGLNFKNRDILYERINKRVDKMFEEGIVEEVKKLSKISLSKTAQAAIGYKEILPFVKGECSIREASENLKKATRNYAKRQLTWFRRDKETNWIYIDEYKDFSEVINSAQDIIKNFNW